MPRFDGGRQRCSMFTLTHFGFFLQIHANCRIRSVYFADRLYTYQELPNDYKVVENITSLVINPVMPEKQPAEQRPKRPGFQSILNSVGKDPLKRWRKEVSIYKTINCLEPASLVVMQHFQLLTSLLSYFEYNQFITRLTLSTV